MADVMRAAARRRRLSERQKAFLRKKLDIINKLFLSSDIPPKLRVNIPEKERDLIRRSSSKGPLTRAIFHSAKVTLFPILMYFWRRFCIWKVMRSFGAYQELWSSEIPEEDTSFQPTEGEKSSRVQKEDRSSQEPKAGRSSQVQKEERSFQEPKAGRISQDQKEQRSSQEPKAGRISRGLKEGRLPGSSPAKTPSKAPKVPGPKKLVAVPSATRYAPGKKPILIFKLSEGLELLLPRPKKKSEPSEEEKDPGADPSGEKMPSLGDSAPQDGNEGTLNLPPSSSPTAAAPTQV